MRPERIEGRTLVGVEVVRVSQPLAKSIIDLINASQVDHADHVDHRMPAVPGRSEDRSIRTGDKGSAVPIYARPKLGDLTVALEEDPHIDGILVDLPQTDQMFDDGVVDVTDPGGWRATRSSTVMPGTQTCAWLADANSRSQFGHTQRVTRRLFRSSSPLSVNLARRSRVPARGRSSAEHGQRAVAQLGSALDWGSRGREFKSRHKGREFKSRQPDQTLADCHARSEPRSSGDRPILDKPQPPGHSWRAQFGRAVSAPGGTGRPNRLVESRVEPLVQTR